MSETMILFLSALFGVVGGIIGGYFQSIYRMREKKFELLYDFRKEIYSKLYKISFIEEPIQEARYDWQIEGLENGAWGFYKKFSAWFKELKAFYETAGWAIDKTVFNRLDKLIDVANKIEAIFFSAKYEHQRIDAGEVDRLYFEMDKCGQEVRMAIQKDMEMKNACGISSVCKKT